MLSRSVSALLLWVLSCRVSAGVGVHGDCAGTSAAAGRACRAAGSNPEHKRCNPCRNRSVPTSSLLCAAAGFLLGSRQTLLETFDGGKTWEPRTVDAARVS